MQLAPEKVYTPPKRKPGYEFFKRFFDVFLCVFALIVLSPVLLVIAILIKCEDGGPVFFKQTRLTKGQKEFGMYKFRSMCVDAEAKLEALMDQNEMEGPVFKIRNDPRITRVGRFLRRSSLDELPQLINVLRGDMSLVGPRPGLPREIAQYDSVSRKRLEITPGMTCYWQIQPNRNSLSFDEWVELDIKYIKERSFLTDWKIIFATFGAVLGMNGE